MNKNLRSRLRRAAPAGVGNGNWHGSSRPKKWHAPRDLGTMLGDKSRREAERKRSEALIAQITGGAALSLQPRESRRLTERSTGVGTVRSPIVHHGSDDTAGTTVNTRTNSGSATASVLSPLQIRFNRYDQDGDGVLDRAEVRAFLRDQVGVDMRTLSRPGFMADVMREYGHNGCVRLEDFEALSDFAATLRPGAQTSQDFSDAVPIGDATKADVGSASSAVDTARSTAAAPAAAIFKEKHAARSAQEAAERVTSLVAPAQQHAYSRLISDWSRSGQAVSSMSSLQRMKDASERAKRRARMQRDFAAACAKNDQPREMKSVGRSSATVGFASSRPTERHSSLQLDSSVSVRSPSRPPPSTRSHGSSSLGLIEVRNSAGASEYQKSASLGSTAELDGWKLQLSPTGTSLSLPGTHALGSSRDGKSSPHRHQNQSLGLQSQPQLGAVPQHQPYKDAASGGWTSS